MIRLDIIKKLNEIDEHFKNINDEEFEKALIRAGHGEIETLSDNNMQFAEIEVDK